MGQAKEKKKRLEKMLQEKPWCVYCGGQVRANTIDHLPAITFFNNRYRPKGLEFPACRECNQGSAQFELKVSFLSRHQPINSSENEKKEFERIFKSIENNHPELIREMLPRRDQIEKFHENRNSLPDAGGVFNVSGPILNEAVEKFGVKVGLALHYFRTQKIVPMEGGVCVRWYSNESLFFGGLPEEFIGMMGAKETLRQGTFEVADQFLFASTFSENGEMSAHWVAFRKAFAMAIFSSLKSEIMRTIPKEIIYRPGLFRIGC